MFFKRLIKRPKIELVNIIILLFIFFAILCAPWIAPHDPFEMNMDKRLSPPSSEHILGTDNLGRDILSRVLYGSRISVPLGILVPLIAALIGMILGSVSGYYGGTLDEILMRLCDFLLSFPELVLALVIIAAVGPSAINAMIAIVIVWVPVYSRLFRGEAQSLKRRTYVEAAMSLGASKKRLILRHIIPNCLAPVIVKITLDIGRAVRVLATLSFFGLGAQPPTPEWGRLVAEGRDYLTYWWFPIFPGIAIFLVSLSLALLGDSLNDLLNPEERR